MTSEAIHAWQMVAPGELRCVSLPPPTLAAGEVLVEIHGCGVCHTDLSYFHDGVPTRQAPPLTLGHEIVGVVVAAAESDSPLPGREVIVPAVLPCHACELCRAGRENRCLQQRMPGNSLGIYGGFASHIPVPGRDLCVIPAAARGEIPLAHLAVVADAVTTPYQAARRAALASGDRVIVIGAGGGVGGYMVQLAKTLGAATVVGIDVDSQRLALVQAYGLDHAIAAGGLDVTQLKAAFRSYCQTQQLPANVGWKIFECSGSRTGQALALALLGFVGKLVVVGYGTDELRYNISRLMAFDAEIIGSWGCAPRHYPQVLQLCLDGRIALEPFVEVQPMSAIREVFEAARHGELRKRVILTPDF
ncbi:6-hydroxycyclohex-1-ene-1-carbonyl-CoA dehydrogenase [Sterolibacterium denitrificans]|uniref:6-hydroxycyclohex-1-ene-1-carbonyl-CoA dehydrogenase n=1 Tax=Sterolibacterium denitrificans TaxID=157592 RepID=UPI0018D51E56|nr:6-hydroxycyclohex-1-ene-1-carbonyl-CoA dehydrogenase [Sterolibacterium denitrificans]